MLTEGKIFGNIVFAVSQRFDSQRFSRPASHFFPDSRLRNDFCLSGSYVLKKQFHVR